MVDKRVIDYFKNYSGKYPLDALKKKVLSLGYTPIDVQEALIALGIVNPNNLQNSNMQSRPQSLMPRKGPVNQLSPRQQPFRANVSSQKPSFNIPKGPLQLQSPLKPNLSPQQKSNVQSKSQNNPQQGLQKATPRNVYGFSSSQNKLDKLGKPDEKKSKSLMSEIKSMNQVSDSGTPWLKIGGYSGILFLVLVISLGCLLYFKSTFFTQGTAGLIVSILGIILILISYVLFYFGFFKLGESTNQNYLKYFSWIIISVFLIIFFIILIGIMVVISGSPTVITGNVINLPGITQPISISGVSDDAGLFDLPGFGIFEKIILFLFLIVLLFFFVIHVFLSIQLIKLKDFKLGRISGIFHLISVIFAIILCCGLFIMAFVNVKSIYNLLSGNKVVFLIVIILFAVLKFSAMLFEIITLLQASKEFE